MQQRLCLNLDDGFTSLKRISKSVLYYYSLIVAISITLHTTCSLQQLNWLEELLLEEGVFITTNKVVLQFKRKRLTKPLQQS